MQRQSRSDIVTVRRGIVGEIRVEKARRFQREEDDALHGDLGALRGRKLPHDDTLIVLLAERTAEGRLGETPRKLLEPLDAIRRVRFHPGEAVVSMLYKGVCGALLGAPPEAMLLFELYLAVGSLTEHANLRMQPRIDRAIRLFWVTPAMHIIHHSATGDDHNHNFSFAISVWDRLFGTLRGDASGRTIGLPKS